MTPDELLKLCEAAPHVTITGVCYITGFEPGVNKINRVQEFYDAARSGVPKLCREIALLKKENVRLNKALEFYADPGTYFAIGIFPDPPCGEFINDCSETNLGIKPGKTARAALRIGCQILEAQNRAQAEREIEKGGDDE